jgi:hypothetical protein
MKMCIFDMKIHHEAIKRISPTEAAFHMRSQKSISKHDNAPENPLFNPPWLCACASSLYACYFSESTQAKAEQ